MAGDNLCLPYGGNVNSYLYDWLIDHVGRQQASKSVDIIIIALWLDLD